MADCQTQTAEVGSVDSSGTNSVAFSSPHVTQVRVPQRDDGAWMSIAAIVGTLIGKMVNDDLIDDAEEVEQKWRDYTDMMGDKGVDEFQTRAELVRQCNDDLWQRYCEYAMCGYQPDYAGILTRVRADAALVTASKRAEISRTADRYNVGVNSNVMCDLLRTEILATVGAASAARESERQMMWKFNAEYVASAAVRFENTYQGRVRLGADLIASAGANYASLAESLRRTAAEGIGDWQQLAALVATLLFTVLRNKCSLTDCGCGSDTPALPVPAP